MPLAILYSVYRCFLPKLLRGEWARLAAVARAYRDFAREVVRGVPAPTALPGDARSRRAVRRKAS
jgi:hypothetical protein